MSDLECEECGHSIAWEHIIEDKGLYCEICGITCEEEEQHNDTPHIEGGENHG